MSAVDDEGEARPTLKIDLPDKLVRPLFEKHRYKIIHGGRGGAKSHSIARALLALGASKPLRILCGREVQRSIRDSVHALLRDTIVVMGLQQFYDALDTEIRGINGTTFIFAGLASQTVDSIKSFEGVDIAWIEEAHVVSRRSWIVLIPTIRRAESEIWISFNPDLDDDETYVRFVVETPPDSVVVQMNYYDNPWFPEVLEQERLHCKRTQPADEYENIWEGKPRTVVEGAIYAREVAEMLDGRRYCRVPYDPRFPVHTVWDLGWNDSMVVIMFQKPHPSACNIIGYYEDTHRKYSEVVAYLDTLGFRWGTDYLPHDGGNKNPHTGTSAEMTLKNLGRRSVKVERRGDPDEEIRQARMLFPRIFLDNTKKMGRDGGYLGCERLYQALRKYRRSIPKTTEEPGAPVHNEWSHGADAFRLLARIVDKVRDYRDIQAFGGPLLPAFQSTDPGMGALG
jgi:phage terminase large subunit